MKTCTRGCCSGQKVLSGLPGAAFSVPSPCLLPPQPLTSPRRVSSYQTPPTSAGPASLCRGSWTSSTSNFNLLQLTRHWEKPFLPAPLCLNLSREAFPDILSDAFKNTSREGPSALTQEDAWAGNPFLPPPTPIGKTVSLSRLVFTIQSWRSKARAQSEHPWAHPKGFIHLPSLPRCHTSCSSMEVSANHASLLLGAPYRSACENGPSKDARSRSVQEPPFVILPNRGGCLRPQPSTPMK